MNWIGQYHTPPPGLKVLLWLVGQPHIATYEGIDEHGCIWLCSDGERRHVIPTNTSAKWTFILPPQHTS